MNTADLTGEIHAMVEVAEGRVRKVAIESTRPQFADRVLSGRYADEAVATVPRLYSICGKAQQLAAELALAAAQGSVAAVVAERTRRIEAEMAQEYLRRALIDWARATGRVADERSLAAARSAFAHDDRDLLRVLVERDVLGTGAQLWYEREHVPDFEIWIARGDTAAAHFLAAVQRDGPRHGACDVPLLPPFEQGDTAQRIVAALDADALFEQTPHFGGHPAETGAVARLREQPLVAALSRTYGRSTLVRFAARLSELARIASEQPSPVPLAGSRILAPGRGLGWVETARGLLLHQIDLDVDGRRIKRYRVVAPTEWNFHPQGPFTSATLGVRELTEADLRQRTEWLLQALDPCVSYRLNLVHA